MRRSFLAAVMALLTLGFASLPGAAPSFPSHAPSRWRRKAPQAPPPPTARVTLAHESGMSDVVAALAGALDGVVVVDDSDIREVLQKPFVNAPFQKVLAQVGRDMDRNWVWRGNSLALQLRYTRGGEGPALELQTARDIAAQMARLIRPFAPRMSGLQMIQAQAQFVDSITPDQQRQMIEGGLPFLKLGPEQQKLLLAINNFTGYDGAAMELRRAALCMEQWERDRAELWHPGMMNYLLVRYTDPAADRNRGQVQIPIPASPRLTKDSLWRGEGDILPARPAPRRKSLRRRWIIPAQRLTVGQLAANLRRDGGPAVSIPKHLAGRKLWIRSVAAPRGTVLLAVADLWGWELSATKRGYRLGPAHYRTARDHFDLLVKLQRTVPPALVHQVRNGREGRYARTNYQKKTVLDALERLGGPNWKSVRVKELDSRTQDMLAEMVVFHKIGGWIASNAARRRPKSYLTDYQRGILTLSGELGPDKHPGLFLRIPLGRGSFGGWGWAVNTAARGPGGNGSR